ncbi:hypothetical protein DPMN_105803 [Dreissena polymorpha]|uniref:Uncharacterized protein n=1 Tax=Dreissena polymorpha TaxID=45954 RepID=A0A9D4QHS9_DREPO|nr:hypothetical protein DPMN_105803 [Dreissena polymorpha]
MCWVCRSRDIDDMIEDSFLESYERFLEEKYKEEFDNCFADEIGGVDDEEQNKIEHLPYVQSPYDYLIDKKLDEEAHLFIFLITRHSRNTSKRGTKRPTIFIFLTMMHPMRHSSDT